MIDNNFIILFTNQPDVADNCLLIRNSRCAVQSVESAGNKILTLSQPKLNQNFCFDSAKIPAFAKTLHPIRTTPSWIMATSSRHPLQFTEPRLAANYPTWRPPVHFPEIVNVFIFLRILRHPTLKLQSGSISLYLILLFMIFSCGERAISLIIVRLLPGISSPALHTAGYRRINTLGNINLNAWTETKR